jgi:hypothetical protein
MTPPQPKSLPSLPLGAREQVDQLCERFESRWAAGETPSLPDYVADAPAEGRAALLKELLRRDVQYRCKRGERASPDDYTARLPDHAELIRQVWVELGFTVDLPGGFVKDTSGDKTQDATPSSLAPLPSSPGPAVAGFEILKELGRGGMGIVYQARHVRLNRPVALKVVHSGSQATADNRARFQAEAEAVALLEHPHIVKVFDYGVCDLGIGCPCPYMALEFVDGGTLKHKLQAGPLGGRQAARLVALLAQAVDFAHQRGILHRDLKPANVLLTADGTPKLTDFGLVKRLDVDCGVTQTGQIVGSPSYMAPEQAAGETRRLTTQVDVYGLGAILYELLTGRAPFAGATLLATLQQVQHEPPAPPRQLNPQLDRDLETICLKCLAKAPADRYGSARALAEDLQHWLAGEPISVRPPTAPALVRLWLKQNFGAAGWTLVLGLGYGLLAAWQLGLAGLSKILEDRAHVYEELPSLPRPWWSLPAALPDWLVGVSFLFTFLVASSAGLLTVLIVRPRNRFAEVATGLLTSTIAGLVLFTLSAAGFYSYRLAYIPARGDLTLLGDAAEARARSRARLPPDTDPVVRAYPDLRERSEAERTRLLIEKFRTDCFSEVPFAILAALAASVFLGVGVILSGTLAAGHVLRHHGGWSRRVLLPYYSLAASAAILCGRLWDLLFYRMLGGASNWADYLAPDLSIVGVLGAAIVAQLRSWPRWLVVSLHLTWLVGLVLRLVVFKAGLH